MVFSLVTLKDVEIASPVGAFTNFKTTDPGAADRKANKIIGWRNSRHTTDTIQPASEIKRL